MTQVMIGARFSALNPEDFEIERDGVILHVMRYWNGDFAKIGSSGDFAQIGSSGNSAQIGSSGNFAQIGSSGDSAQIDASGKDAVIASAGAGASVTGVDGTWVSLAEFDRTGKCVGFATGCIGKDGLKTGVRYVAKGGKLVEA